MDKVKGMTTCKVCGRDFPLLVEEHYVAQDPKATGVVAAMASTDKVYEYDAIDCPFCGCQNVLQQRKPMACCCECEECDKAEEEEEQGPSIEEMTEFLCDFCHNQKECDNCPLHTPAHKCGRGVWFNQGMTPEQVAAAYKDAKEAIE